MFGAVYLLVIPLLPSILRSAEDAGIDAGLQRSLADEAEASCDHAALHVLASCLGFPTSLIAFNVKLRVCICVPRLPPLRRVSRPPSINDHKLWSIIGSGLYFKPPPVHVQLTLSPIKSLLSPCCWDMHGCTICVCCVQGSRALSCERAPFTQEHNRMLTTL